MSNALALLIFKLNSQITLMERLLTNIGSAKDTASSRAQLNSLLDSSKDLAAQASAQIKVFPFPNV